MRRYGFSLIELIISLSLILIISAFSVLSSQTLTRSLNKQKEINRLLAASTNFLESLKLIPFSKLKDYHLKTLEKGKIQIQITPLNPHLQKIELKTGFPSLKLYTLRSNYD